MRGLSAQQAELLAEVIAKAPLPILAAHVGTFDDGETRELDALVSRGLTIVTEQAADNGALFNVDVPTDLGKLALRVHSAVAAGASLTAMAIGMGGAK